MQKTNKASKIYSILTYTILIFLGLLTFIPFLFAFMTSLKSVPQFAHNYWTLSFPIYWQNYIEAGKIVLKYVSNSFVITIISVLGITFLSVITSYVFARFEFPGKKVLFYMIIILLMIPAVLVLIPQFMLMKHMHLLNSRLGIILSYIAGGQAISIFILRTFIENIPKDLFAAARIDGANHFQVLKYMIFPLAKPIIGTVVILNTLAIWNDYIWPLVLLHDDRLRTIPIGLQHFTKTAVHGNIDYGGLMAGYLIGAIPMIILFIFTMRYFIRGLTAGAIKA